MEKTVSKTHYQKRTDVARQARAAKLQLKAHERVALRIERMQVRRTVR
jgi:hypothetical protein